jgi:phenylacetate-CoA ligase
MDEMKVCVEAKGEAIDDSTMRDESQKLAALIKEIIGITAAVDIVMPGTIERSPGKVQRIRDRRNLSE